MLILPIDCKLHKRCPSTRATASTTQQTETATESETETETQSASVTKPHNKGCGKPCGINFFRLSGELKDEDSALKYAQELGLIAKQVKCPTCRC